MYTTLIFAFAGLAMMFGLSSGSELAEEDDASGEDTVDSGEDTESTYPDELTETSEGVFLGTEGDDSLAFESEYVRGSDFDSEYVEASADLGPGNDTIDGVDAEILSGSFQLGEGDDHYIGSGFDNDVIVEGGAGDDLISVGPSETSLYDGGEGDDTITLDAGYGSVSDGASIEGGAGDDVISAGSYALSGHADYDTGYVVANGGAGDDTLDVGWGAVTGGDGNDVIDLEYEGSVSGGAGDDEINLGATNLEENLLGDGGAGDDTITAFGAGTTLVGGAGDDVLSASLEDFLGSNWDWEDYFGGRTTSRIVIEGGEGADQIAIEAELYFEGGYNDAYSDWADRTSFHQFNETAEGGEAPAQLMATIADFESGVDTLVLPLDVGADGTPATLSDYEVVTAPSGGFTDIVMTYTANGTSESATYTVRMQGVDSLAEGDFSFL